MQPHGQAGNPVSVLVWATFSNIEGSRNQVFVSRFAHKESLLLLLFFNSRATSFMQKPWTSCSSTRLLSPSVRQIPMCFAFVRPFAHFLI
jgi:hypothetical protein